MPGVSERRLVKCTLILSGIFGILPSRIGWQVCTVGICCEDGRRFCNLLCVEDFLLSALWDDETDMGVFGAERFDAWVLGVLFQDLVCSNDNRGVFDFTSSLSGGGGNGFWETESDSICSNV